MKYIKWMFLLVSMISVLGVTPVQAAEDVRLNSNALAQQRVAINEADAPTLAKQLKGVGLKRAQAIVAYRDEFGPFSSIEDLQKVKGLGKKTIQKNADRIQF